MGNYERMLPQIIASLNLNIVQHHLQQTRVSERVLSSSQPGSKAQNCRPSEGLSVKVNKHRSQNLNESGGCGGTCVAVSIPQPRTSAQDE